MRGNGTSSWNNAESGTVRWRRGPVKEMKGIEGVSFLTLILAVTDEAILPAAGPAGRRQGVCQVARELETIDVLLSLLFHDDAVLTLLLLS